MGRVYVSDKITRYLIFYETISITITLKEEDKNPSQRKIIWVEIIWVGIIWVEIIWNVTEPVFTMGRDFFESWHTLQHLQHVFYLGNFLLEDFKGGITEHSRPGFSKTWVLV